MLGCLQEKNGKYYAVISIRNETGERKRKWIYTGFPIKGNNKRNAKKRLAELIAEYADTVYIEPTKTLLCDLITDWVVESQGRVEPTTYDVYEHILNKHLFPYFKGTGVTLDKITPDVINKYYTDKQNQGLSPNTVIKHHGILRPALQQAYKAKRISENACDFADKPKSKKYRGGFYNAEEIKALLFIAKGSSIEVPIYLAAHLGLRRSEIIGLRWDAVDFSTETLTIKHKIVRGKKDGKMTTYASNDLKTQSSHRILPLNKTLLTYLKELKNKQDANRERNGNSHIYEFDGYICVNELGNILNPDYVTDTFGKIIKRNNLKHIRFHDLRHSCASLLLALGYSMKDIQEWLGHSNYQTTANLYSHIDPKNKRNMIEGISDALSLQV
jgi:integrase